MDTQEMIGPIFYVQFDDSADCNKAYLTICPPTTRRILPVPTRRGLYLELKPDTEVGYLDAALQGEPGIQRIDGKLYRQVDPSEPETEGGQAWCDLARPGDQFVAQKA